MSDLAKRIAESTMATLAARVVQLIVLPVVLAVLYWTTAELVNLGKRMAVIEAARVQGRGEIITRIERLEASDIRDRETLALLARQLATVDATTHAILREIENLRRDAILREQQRGRP